MLNSLATPAEKELAVAKKRISELESLIQSLVSFCFLIVQKARHLAEIEQWQDRLESATSETQDSVAKFKELEREQEDLLVCLADQDLEIQELQERLRSYGEVISE